MGKYTKIWSTYKGTSTPKECKAIINNKTGDIWKPYKGTTTPKVRIGKIKITKPCGDGWEYPSPHPQSTNPFNSPE